MSMFRHPPRRFRLLQRSGDYLSEYLASHFPRLQRGVQKVGYAKDSEVSGVKVTPHFLTYFLCLSRLRS